MDNKTKGILATVAAVLLCGCPGLFMCLFGAVAATGVGTYDLGADTGNIPPTTGYVLVCASVIMILIPVVVGVLTLRRKPQAPVSNEPLPPAS